MVDAVRQADVAVLGEVHDNPYHHQAQADLLAAMVADGVRPVVVWEMIDRDQQSSIDDFAAGGTADPDLFAKAVNWSESGWPDWSIYRPIAEVAISADLPMIAGDLDRSTMKTIMSAGIDKALPRAADLWPIDEIYEEVAEAAQLDALFYGHCELVPRDHLRPMLSAQYARDMSLALAVLDGFEQHNAVVLITGNGHARRDLAVPMLLEHAQPDLDLAAIGIRENSGVAIDLAAEPFDYAGFTPGIERPDPCEELREIFAKHHQTSGDGQ